MTWIKYRRNEPIPDELYYDGWQMDDDNDVHTPLMLWIKYRRNEDIPEDFYYDYC